MKCKLLKLLLSQYFPIVLMPHNCDSDDKSDRCLHVITKLVSYNSNVLIFDQLLD